MKGCKHLSTPNELKIASNLTISRSKIFLESRSYMRQSLSDIFGINPLDIPLIANPGEPPQLPSKMGFLSVSHCQDAFIIAWHKKKIGIDIERIDREFNYKAIQSKYFPNMQYNMHSQDFSRKSVLYKWCGIEAAIKWDHGKLSKDLKEWQYELDDYLHHRSKNIRLIITHFNFLKWTISIADKNKNSFPQIICNCTV